MHFLLAVVLWAMSLGVAYAVGRAWVESKHCGGWPRLGAWLVASLSAIGFTSAYFALAVALVETFSADPSTSTAVAPVWDAWLYAIIPPLGGLAAASFLTSWAQRYRDGVTERANFPSFAALNERYAGITSVGQATREVTSDVTRRTRAAVRRARRKPDPTAVFAPRYDPSRDLSGVQFSAPHIELPKIELPKIETPKVDLGKVEIGGGNSGDDGGAGLAILLLVALVIAALLGVITAWIVIARVAGTAEPMPEAAASA